MLVLDKIKEIVEKYPLTKAIVSADEELTYKELWEKSGRLALWLSKELNDNKDPLVVYGHKSPWMLVCFLACVRSGRAYCPVDISMPGERINDILATVANPIAISTKTKEESEAKIQSGQDFIFLEQLEEITAPSNPSEEVISESEGVKADDTYYIIFTSGSTGKPKGVEISHGALSAYTDWSVTLGESTDDMKSGAENKSGSVFLNQAPFSFDLSVMDIYTSLVSGSTIYCLTKEMQNDGATLLEAIRRGNINYWVSTPSFADMCLADRNFDSEAMPQIRAFLFCGEKLTKETASRLMERFPSARVVNTYGPTESTVAVTGIEITKEMLEADKELPIGFVKDGTKIEIARENNELLISGNTLSKGYYKNKEKTEEAFFEGSDGVRKYHTGDAGFFEDDVLYYKGRIDLQIKLHGYRIELGDIEANLMNIKGMEAAAVVPKRTAEGKIRHLVAFVVQEGAEGTFSEGKAVKDELKKFLPDYMVPKKIVFETSLPMTPNGKTDRKKLEEKL